VWVCFQFYQNTSSFYLQKPRYVTPKATGDVYMQEPFDSDDAIDR